MANNNPIPDTAVYRKMICMFNAWRKLQAVFNVKLNMVETKYAIPLEASIPHILKLTKNITMHKCIPVVIPPASMNLEILAYGI
jgi:hypothetical protein